MARFKNPQIESTKPSHSDKGMDTAGAIIVFFLSMFTIMWAGDGTFLLALVISFLIAALAYAVAEGARKK